ncbi:MAG: flagellar biosynthesis protein FlgL [Hyphomicrobiales bacterium]|nr:flagellar biosynthesis protein FlgL [Hyphomicrobiales bacterium]MBV9426494.1 flagellar biosynthesis protein FlgL [Bradyrhizobiaceae bacterium]
MAISGIGTGSALAAQNTQALVNLQNQLNQLTQQLSTGQKSQDYAGLGSQAGLTVGLDAQLSALTGYGNAISLAGTNISIAQNALSQVGTMSNDVVQSINAPSNFTLDNNGQTTAQSGAVSQLDAVLAALNSQAAGNYLFSGSAVNQPSVASTDAILNGNGVQAGLKQVIAERAQADIGTSGLGRLNIPAAAGNTVSISDVATSPFGFKLAGITSNLTGATVSGAPPSMSVTLGSNPNNGDTIGFNLTLPDGSSQTVTLQATTASPPGANQFTIGTNAIMTAGSLQAALTTAVTNLAQTALPAASAIAAANDFFNSNPPQRVAGPAFGSATALVNGTSANTVMWYTGDNGSTPARSTALAQVGPSTTVAYGVRANEPALSNIVANIAVLAATSYAPGNPNASASYAALTQRVAANLDGQSGTQSLSNIQGDLANAQTTIKNAQNVNQQTQNTLTNMLQQIENVSPDQVGAQILTLQTNLQASMDVTGLLSKLSLVNFLPA